jgi:glycosyltransferase involved in cell wall biosynthesis
MNEIMINGRFLLQPTTGVQRLAFEVVKTFDRMIDQGVIDTQKYSLTLLVENNSKAKPCLDFNNVSIAPVGKLSGHAWEQFELPRYSFGKVLINLCGPAPVVKYRQLAIIHDAVPYACPSEFSRAFHIWYKAMFKLLCKRTEALITVSNFSKKELSHYCGVKEERFTVAYPGIDHFASFQADSSILESNKLFGKKYVLAVGSLSPRKNFLGLVKAIELLDDPEIELVVVGGVFNKVFSDIELPIKERIKYVGRVSDEQLKALYSNALCFAFPSFYEGFGLPPVEAMTCKCPVIAGNVTSMPEVCGEAAVYCDSYNPQDIADKIRKLCSDERLRKHLIAKGTEQAGLYTWEACGHAIWAAVERLFEPLGFERGEDDVAFASAV